MPTKPSRERRRLNGAAGTIWVGEAFQAGRWYTLWTTCRLYKYEAQEALQDHATYSESTKSRVIKFGRT